MKPTPEQVVIAKHKIKTYINDWSDRMSKYYIVWEEDELGVRLINSTFKGTFVDYLNSVKGRNPKWIFVQRRWGKKYEKHNKEKIDFI